MWGWHQRLEGLGLRGRRLPLRTPGGAPRWALGALWSLLALLVVEDLVAGSTAQPPFADRTEEAGLDFLHYNGMSGEFYMAEINGSGCALFDYDNDGDLDVYLVQGLRLGESQVSADGATLRDRLYRNDLSVAADGSRSLRFTDVTQQAGIEAVGYGFGAATGDFDGDGWVDLYVTNFGSNQLWRNRGDGTFEDVTAGSGTDDERWSVGALFFDYDRDGRLDLYVGNYVDFSLANHKVCRTATGARDYCGPGAYAGVSDSLFHNRGDGTFEDRSVASGIAGQPGKSLGAISGDFDDDGWPDLYVTNDLEANFLWRNQGDGTFVDEALLAGVALNMHGHAEASMGVDAADFDRDGDEDLVMTHLVTETNTLYRNDGGGLFEDVTISTGLGPPSLPYTSWGVRLFDYDNDGWLDLFVANGAVRVIESLAQEGDPFPFHEPNQLFRGLGDGRFALASDPADPVFARSEVSRGTAFGDVDNDGDTDILVANNNGSARLLINQVGDRAHWLGLRLVDGDPPRDVLGTEVVLELPNQPLQMRRVRTDGSFASAGDPRVLFGLGELGEPLGVEVTWPDGARETWAGLEPDRYHLLRRGEGRNDAP